MEIRTFFNDISITVKHKNGFVSVITLYKTYRMPILCWERTGFANSIVDMQYYQYVALLWLPPGYSINTGNEKLIVIADLRYGTGWVFSNLSSYFTEKENLQAFYQRVLHQFKAYNDLDFFQPLSQCTSFCENFNDRILTQKCCNLKTIPVPIETKIDPYYNEDFKIT